MSDSWEEYAACRGVDINTFFDADDFVDPDVQGATAKNKENSERRLRARLICSICPVQVECLTDALERDDQHAFLGGLTPAQRNQVKDGKPVEVVAARGRAQTKPMPTQRGWELVRRFARGERVEDLAAEYGLARQSVLEEIRSGMAVGEWATTRSPAA